MLYAPRAIKVSAFIFVAFLCILCGAALVAIFSQIQSDLQLKFFTSKYFIRVLKFTLSQALLSTLLSIIGGLLLSWALYRHPKSKAKSFLLQLMTLSMVLPALIIISGIIKIYGANGLLWSVLPLEKLNIYGLPAILLAHTLYNIPLSAMLFLNILGNISPDYEKLAYLFNIRGIKHFKLLVWPYLRPYILPVAFFVFLLCLSSFTIVLILGGGPRASTLEVELYRNLMLGVEGFPKAALLTIIQLLITLICLIFIYFLHKPLLEAPASSISKVIIVPPTIAEAIISKIIIFLMGAFLVIPIFGVMLSLFDSGFFKLLQDLEVWHATFNSIILAVGTAIIGLIISICLLLSQNNRAKHKKGYELLLNFIPYAALIISPMVIGSGWFIIIYRLLDPDKFSLYIVFAINIALVLPICMHIMLPKWKLYQNQYGNLVTLLSPSWLVTSKYIYWPIFKETLERALCFSILLSLGNLTFITLFTSEGFLTLPVLIQRKLSSYHSNAGSSLTLLLFILYCLILLIFYLFSLKRRGVNHE